MDVGRRARELRKERGMTINTLAARSGISDAALSRIERGLRSPGSETVEKIARGLGVDPGELFKEPALSPLDNPSTPADRFLEESREFLRLAEENPDTAREKMMPLASSYMFARKYRDGLSDGNEEKNDATDKITRAQILRASALGAIMNSPAISDLEWQWTLEKVREIEREAG
jgi:transcriptional regulator with XRE-family HTH domain